MARGANAGTYDAIARTDATGHEKNRRAGQAGPANGRYVVPAR